MIEGEHRILKYRPRTHTPLPALQRAGHLAPDLSRYEMPRESRDDYRQRMVANAAAIGFTALLTGLGVWLAITLADLRNAQDCVLMGRRDCAHISAQKIDLIRHN
ncbi:hypothetical protein [Afipia clevelandensis]|uniref:Uncharacterized protein n=1 Tax=Afipia clevelandensis ATCC 49720 TaxID=883079 RepID=K8PMQ4_9BRAD|nr:hypothetical protein [Afipia clevelandensis]EKS42886.1 hypothetical protein HMPREF9696_00429 [Afipia clevelandensis ATCC 49720]